MRQIIWVGPTLKDLRRFPDDVKDEIGYALYLAQIGKKANITKKYEGLSGVLEIKSDYGGDTFRTVYAAKIDEDLYILHAFEKKSHTKSKLPKEIKRTIEIRYKDAIRYSKEEKRKGAK